MRSFLSEEEYALVKQFVVLDYTRQVLERDLAKIPKARFKFSRPYEQVIEGALKRLSGEMWLVKNNIRKIGLKIQKEKDSTALRFEWFLDGYQGDASVRFVVLKEFVELKIDELLKINK